MSRSATIINKAIPGIMFTGRLIKQSFQELKKNDPLRMAGATSFFSTFAITPILIIIIQLLGVFFKQDRLSSQLILRLQIMLGRRAAGQIQEVAEHITALAQNWYVTVFGFLFLIFVATTLFSVIENSLNQIWKIRIKPNAGFMFGLKRRLRSLVIIILAGILFVIGLLIEGVQALLGNYIDYLLPEIGKYLNTTINEVVFILIATAWFSCIFRFLTVGRPLWKIAFSGGLLTTLLFDIGKIVLRFCLSKSNIGTIYGTSGSIVLIMLFVFYSSFIFYFGGCVIKILSEMLNQPIRPLKEAYRYEIHEV
ncbi:YihY/virulence factor BrkB family protein [Rubrolithibacter danxiaensis]|uniref:YihY/virulence factor BrkB family protein n=1 Tax=Rubrolithibacter danxiaensis TaxID=3390805 RepID=UPI003BF91AA5